MTDGRTVVVLAAGEGTRMRSALPKTLHPVLGRSLLGHALAATEPLAPARWVVVVGHGAEQVSAHLSEIAPYATTALQSVQRGTGHATRVALEALEAGSPPSPGLSAGPGLTAGPGTVVVVNADVPLLRAETVTRLVAAHESSGAAATILTAAVARPYGLGRIIRRPDSDSIDAIVEERDATPEQRKVCEINAGLYAFDATLLSQALGKLTTRNDQGEEYLTEVVSLLVGAGFTVNAFPVADPTEVLGCNDRVDLAQLWATLRDRVNTEWMRRGVTIVDPATTWVDVTVQIGRDAVIEPHTFLRGACTIGTGAVVGPDTTLVDTWVGEQAHVQRAQAIQARIGPRAQVGPFAYLRPGTVLGDRSKVGTFVEVKNSDIGTGTKIPHLSYVGDATIGEETNIGAANVVVNYDGVHKHRTVVGSHVRTGSDTMLVAPVTVGDGAYTAAGSVITHDVPPGALGVARSIQRNIEGWVMRRRAGTASASAAETALAAEALLAVETAGPAQVAEADPGG